ncbi:MAG: protein-glutamate O-methyltransferase CheR [Cytophagales bacterium]
MEKITTTTDELISDTEIKSINQALMAKYGIDFTQYEKTSFKRRLLRLMHKHGINNSVELWMRFLHDPNFVESFKEGISVGLTEMFRNPSVWNYIHDYIKKLETGSSKINIWHAGCSTGEEFYSMAITAQEAGIFSKCQFLCTDMSLSAVEKTESGIYDLDLLAAFETNYRHFNPNGNFKLYYTTGKETLTFSKNLKEQAHFWQSNLVTDHVEGKFDIIFCRNVMIYFEDDLKLKIIQKLHNGLLPNGLLVIGHFDALPKGSEAFFDYENSSLKIFKKI